MVMGSFGHKSPDILSYVLAKNHVNQVLKQNLFEQQYEDLDREYFLYPFLKRIRRYIPRRGHTFILDDNPIRLVKQLAEHGIKATAFPPFHTVSIETDTLSPYLSILEEKINTEERFLHSNGKDYILIPGCRSQTEPKRRVAASEAITLVGH